MPATKPKPARELAARALCVQFGFDPDADSAGQPTWQTYLPAADAVLEAIGFQEPDYIRMYRMREVKAEEWD